MGRVINEKVDQKERAGFNQTIIIRTKWALRERQISTQGQVISEVLQEVHPRLRDLPVQEVVVTQENDHDNEKVI